MYALSLKHSNLTDLTNALISNCKTKNFLSFLFYDELSASSFPFSTIIPWFINGHKPMTRSWFSSICKFSVELWPASWTLFPSLPEDWCNHDSIASSAYHHTGIPGALALFCTSTLRTLHRKVTLAAQSS